MNAHRVLDFWFADGMERRWFRSTPELDGEIRARFEAKWRRAAAGEFDDWTDSPDGTLALAILLDQFPLNMFRGQGRAFATEARAVAVTLDAVARGLDQALARERVAFLYMPLMHSEDLAHQDAAVRLFEMAGLESNARFARHHRALVRRFGRFPHRNAMLGRDSTAQERAYLASPEAFIG
jgi:uncharacterized protein (DUF924 family)